MSTLTLPNGTTLTRVTRASCLARIASITPYSYEYSQGRIERSTDRRADCTGWKAFVLNSPKTGPGTYLHAHNTASFYTQRLIIPIDWSDLLPGDSIGYFAPTSPGNGGHAAIWLGGDRRPDGTFDVSDHGGGWGPKRRQVRWDGRSTGWLHPDKLAPWRYVGIIEADGTTYTPDSTLEDDDMDWRPIQQALVSAGYDLGSSGPNGDGVDNVAGALTIKALTAGLAKPTPIDVDALAREVAGKLPGVDPAAIDAAVRAALGKVKATTTLTLQ